MIKKWRVALDHMSSVFFGSRRASLTSLLFILALLILCYELYKEVSGSVRLEFPIGQEEEKTPELNLKSPVEILIINSYHPGQTFSDNEMSGITEALQKASPKIQAKIEYLDSKYYQGIENSEIAEELFVYKYSNKKIPVVIVTDNPALNFALKYRARIFPDSQIVFCGVNGYKKEMLDGHENVTGIAETLAAGDTVKIALKLHPKTRTVFVIHDYTETGMVTRKEAEEQFSNMQLKADFSYPDNMTKAEMQEFLKKLPGDSIVLALSYSVFRDGEVINHKNIAKFLSSNSPVPVYGLHQERLGYGIVGGSLLGGKLHGANAARYALRILSGEKASGIPVELKALTTMMFDFNQLKRFGIPRSSLPEGSIVANRPIPFIERHLHLFFSSLLVMIILTSGIIGLGFNMYQRIRAGEIIKKQVVELEAKNAELERFTYSVSHDLKSPLITIKGFLGTLSSDARAGNFDRMESDIRRIGNAAKKMQSLLDDLLELSRIGRIVNPPSEFSMTELVSEAVELLHGSIKTEGVKIIIDPSMPSVYADKARILEVLQNLVENAVKFMGEQKAPQIEIGCRTVSGENVYFVKDNGIGIESKFHEKIFSLFDKLDATSEGTGIGLALVKQIVELHNGRIWVESEGSGKGSTFCFTLKNVAKSGKLT